VIIVLFSLLFLGIVLLWVVKSIQIIGPTEMAFLLMFGKPIRFLNSGLNFVPYLICTLAKFPKKLFNFDYHARQVITRAGKYKGVEYGVQVIDVDSVAYICFPRSGRLREILQSDIPTDKEALKIWTEDIIVAAIRFVLGRKTWKECTENIDRLKVKIEEIFRKADGALLKAGFEADNLNLVIKEIKLSKELEDSLVAPDRERLKKDASNFESQSQAMKWVGMVFHSMALAEGRDIREIQEKIRLDKGLQDKFVDYALKMNSDIELADRKAIFKFINEGNNGGGIPGNIVLFTKLLEKFLGMKENSKDQKKEAKDERKKKISKMDGKQYFQFLRDEDEKRKKTQ